MTAPILRPYQQTIVDQINDGWKRGAKNNLVALSTGAGKTTVFSSIAHDHNGLSCIIAHRQELVSQISMSLARFGTYHRIVAPKNVITAIIREHQLEFGRSFYNPQAPAAVAGVNTLVARQDALERWAKQVTLWIGDESHHFLRENLWGTAISMFPHAKGLGVTATPQRADGKGLGAHSDGVFHHMILGPSMRELIEMGYLTDYNIVAAQGDFDVERLKITATGDYSPKQMREAARESHIVGDVVENYIKYAMGKQGITFATDVETANEIAAQYREAGIDAQAVSAGTPEHVRNDFIRRFRRGELKQLVNVDLFGEGFDLPALEVVSKARPTMSLAVFMQQFGRALRPFPGKDRALIIDHVGNVVRHGLPDIPRRWTLDARDKRSSRKIDPELVPLTTCLNCFQVYERVNAGCPFCGFKPDPAGRRRPEQVDGDLTMLDQDVLHAMRAAAMAAMESPSDLAQRVASVAGQVAGMGAAKRQQDKIESLTRLKDTIALWAGHQRALGRDDQQSYRRFFHTFGIDVLSAMALPRVDADKLVIDIESTMNHNPSVNNKEITQCTK